jgi:hypothetical protein
MKRTLSIYLLGALVVLPGNAIYAQDITGTWQGTIKAGPAELRVQIHIAKSDKGFTGTLDSVDQGLNGIPMDSLTLDGSSLKFTVGTLMGSYEGRVSADGDAVAGTWTQIQPLPLDLKRGAFKVVEHKPAKPSDIDGAWTGTLDTPNGGMRIVFHITNTEDGLTATADLPDLGNSGLPVTSVTREGPTLKMEMKQFGGGFEGAISPDLKTVTGTFGPVGNALPLVLKR